MLLTGFDSKYLNTLYVDKNLKYHGLIQAFSRTNRILNDTKPYGNILDFRGQQDAVDEAIALFSGEKTDNPKEIWLVDSAPKVIEKFQDAVQKLSEYMQSQGLECQAENVYSLQGDEARAGFINCFKEVQRYRTQLEQYTDINEQEKAKSKNCCQKRLCVRSVEPILKRHNNYANSGRQAKTMRLVHRLKTLILNLFFLLRQSLTTII